MGNSTKCWLVILQWATDIVGTVHVGFAVKSVQRYVNVSMSNRCVTMIAVWVVVRVIVDRVMIVIVVPVKMPMAIVVICAMTMPVPMLSRCWLNLKNGNDRE